MDLLTLGRRAVEYSVRSTEYTVRSAPHGVRSVEYGIDSIEGHYTIIRAPPFRTRYSVLSTAYSPLHQHPSPRQPRTRGLPRLLRPGPPRPLRLDLGVQLLQGGPHLRQLRRLLRRQLVRLLRVGAEVVQLEAVQLRRGEELPVVDAEGDLEVAGRQRAAPVERPRPLDRLAGEGRQQAAAVEDAVLRRRHTGQRAA